MKREISREKVLPVFSIDVRQLDILWQRLLVLFDNPNDVYAGIEISLPSEILEFNSVDELIEYNHLTSDIKSFRIFFSKNNHYISIHSNLNFNDRAKVVVSGGTEYWCAGAIETVDSFVYSHKLWYSWFVSVPVGWLFILFASVPNIVLLTAPKDESIKIIVILSWLAITVTLGILYFAKNKLLPSYIILINNEKGFLRRNVAELSLAVAMLSVALTVVGWFLS